MHCWVLRSLFGVSGVSMEVKLLVSHDASFTPVDTLYGYRNGGNYRLPYRHLAVATSLPIPQKCGITANVTG